MCAVEAQWLSGFRPMKPIRIRFILLPLSEEWAEDSELVESMRPAPSSAVFCRKSRLGKGLVVSFISFNPILAGPRMSQRQ